MAAKKKKRQKDKMFLSLVNSMQNKKTILKN